MSFYPTIFKQSLAPFYFTLTHLLKSVKDFVNEHICYFFFFCIKYVKLRSYFVDFFLNCCNRVNLCPAPEHIIKQKVGGAQPRSPSDRSVRHRRASRHTVSARFVLFSKIKMLFFITVSVLLASAQAKFYTDCGIYPFF